MDTRLSLGLLAALICFPCGRAPEPPASLAPVRKTEWARSILHSHNDYEHDHPLRDAVAHRLHSVEADIWVRNGELRVGHLPWLLKGTLRELYLEPLARAVKAGRGSVLGDGRTFYLWVDIKDSDPDTSRLLREELARYSFLSTFSESDTITRAVTVVLTGNKENKRRFTEEPGPVSACRDEFETSSLSGQHDSPRWKWTTLNWKSIFRWAGQGPIPSTEDQILRRLVAEVHRARRRIRFFNAPDRPEFWSLAAHAGVDAIGTDDPEKLARFRSGR